MRAIAWLLGVCLGLIGLLAGLVAGIAYFAALKNRWKAIGLGVIAFCVVACGSSLTQWANRSTDQGPGRISLAAFDAIINGLTKRQCVSIFGQPGSSSSALQVMSDKAVQVESLTWFNEDGSNLTLGFIEDRMFSKTQCGLR